MLNISSKDKSVILLIAVCLVILWAVGSSFFYFYNRVSFKSSEINKINEIKTVDWFNVVEPVKSDKLKHKITLLHFFSYSSSQDLQAITNLKKLQDKYPNLLTIIGVHYPTFENEKNYLSVKKAIIRNEIDYPVINDASLELSKKFDVKKSSTMLLFGLNGKILYNSNNFEDINEFYEKISKTISKNKLSINRDELPIVLEKNTSISNILDGPKKMIFVDKFSYKNIEFPAIFIANTGNNSIIISKLSGEIIYKIGSGISGFENGEFSKAKFSKPQSMLYSNNKLYIADTGNNSIRVADFEAQTISTLIGNGNQGSPILSKRINAEDTELNHPSDLEFFPSKNSLVINNSGTNQILVYDLDKKDIAVLAGNSQGDDVDGIYPNNSLNNVADMAVHNKKLYLIQSKNGLIKSLNIDGELVTINANNPIKFQNPNAIIVDDSGIYIADSFNHSIKKYDLTTNQITKIAGNNRGEEIGDKTQFDEPSGMVAFIDKIYVSDTNNNRILMVNKANATSSLLDILPQQKLSKETLVEYLPRLESGKDLSIKTNQEIEFKINVKKNWKINHLAPSFLNLLELQDNNNANILANFDWNEVIANKITLPKIASKKEYLLQGKIYYCKDTMNSLCYIKSYEQKITGDDASQLTEIVVDIGQ
ncbi:MAG: thioredoxin-like domain-containing protein [Alphaproteobacteria bacterium]